MTAKVWTAARAASISVAGIFVIGLLTGLLYEQAQRALDREHFPQVGRSVDIGGRMLNIYCSGEGQPAVILESGANWPLHSAVHGPNCPRPQNDILQWRAPSRLQLGPDRARVGSRYDCVLV